MIINLIKMKLRLGNKGILIEKDSINKELFTKIIKDLTIFPLKNNYVINPKATISYQITDKYLIVPRFYDNLHLQCNLKYGLIKNTNTNIIFNGNIRENQEDSIKKIIKELILNYRCIFSANTGSGKTIIALKLISLIKRKTIIIVHKHFLLEQWKKRIEEFLPTLKIGEFHGIINSLEDCDIAIVMIQSITNKELDITQFIKFSFVIFDECHHIPSVVFSKSLFKIGKLFMLGLSATVERNDDLTKVLLLHFGKIIKSSSLGYYNDNIQVDLINYESNAIEKKLYNGLVNIQDLINQITLNNNRNMFCLELINSLNNDKDRNILVLTDRVNNAKFLHSQLNDEYTGLFIGGMKKDQREISMTKKIIIGTYSMISEAFDCPKLNTLIMITPKVEITQIVGRILRKWHSMPPLIKDITDNNDTFKRWSCIRINKYKEMNFLIKKSF